MSKPHRLFDNDLVRSLTGFRHSPRTDMAKKTINNVDFITLCMYAVGQLTSAELRCLAKAWRGQFKVLDAYFGPHFGWTATDVSGGKRYGGQFSSARHTKPWYRKTENVKRHRTLRDSRGDLREGTADWVIVPMQRYTNDLTVHGLARARHLLACPPRTLRPEGLGHVESLLCGVAGAL